MTAKTKLILKNCTRLVSFILILLLLLYGVSFLLEPKNNDDAAGFVNPNASGYLSLEKDTLDVFIVGNSDAYSGFFAYGNVEKLRLYLLYQRYR